MWDLNSNQCAVVAQVIFSEQLLRNCFGKTRIMWWSIVELHKPTIKWIKHNAYISQQHDQPIKTVNFVQAPNYTCIVTGSWDKTLKFWDMRQATPIATFQLPERCYCADIVYPMAIVGTAQRGILCYQLDNQPREFKVGYKSVVFDTKKLIWTQLNLRYFWIFSRKLNLLLNIK